MLESLPIATDPSLKYFYGEALLKSNQSTKAMQKLYQYIDEQGLALPTSRKQGND